MGDSGYILGGGKGGKGQGEGGTVQCGRMGSVVLH